MQAEKLSRRTKFLYGIGDTGFGLTSTIIGAYFAIFLTDVVGISLGIAAAAIFFGRSWDYVNDPLIDRISDRTRTRWGRRRHAAIPGGRKTLPREESSDLAAPGVVSGGFGIPAGSTILPESEVMATGVTARRFAGCPRWIR